MASASEEKKIQIDALSDEDLADLLSNGRKVIDNSDHKLVYWFKKGYRISRRFL
jgi:hypothetical protein